MPIGIALRDQLGADVAARAGLVPFARRFARNNDAVGSKPDIGRHARESLNCIGMVLGSRKFRRNLPCYLALRSVPRGSPSPHCAMILRWMSGVPPPTRWNHILRK